MFAARSIALVLFAACLAGLHAADEQASLQRARELIRTGKAAEAVPIYQELLAADPKNPTLVMNLAIAYFQAGEYNRAAEQCRLALTLQPGWGNALLFLGASHLRLGEPQLAAEYLEKAAEAQPDERNTRLMLAQALHQSGRSGEAVPHFEKASGLLPENPSVWHGLWLSCAAVVEQSLREIESSGRESVFWHALAGDDHARRERLGLALRHYREALALQPNLGGLHGSIASVYTQAGRSDWAEQELQKEPARNGAGCDAADAACLGEAKEFGKLLALADSLEPLAPSYWRVKACRGLQARAEQELAKLPASAPAHEVAARVLVDRALYAEAAKRWREALALDPQNRGLMEGLAVSLRNSRDHEAALALLEKLLRIEPDRPRLRYLYGDTLLEVGRPGDARSALEAAVEGDSTLLEARASLGRAYLQLDQAEKALAHLEAALSIDEDGTIHYQAGVACRSTGDVERAKRMFAEYARIRAAAQRRQSELDAEIPLTAP